MEPLPRLSPKERRALALFLEGLEVEEIGRRMQASPFAVQTFLRNAGVKLSMIPE